MNSECDKFSNQILSQAGKLDDTAQKHIETCEDCRMMYETWQGLKKAKKKNPTPSVSSDFLIQREAQRVASNRHSITKSYKRWASAVAMAACAVFICWLTINQMRYSARQRQHEKERNTPTAMENMITNNFRQSQQNAAEKTTNQKIAYQSKTTQQANTLSWENVDLNDDFFEIETEIEYCQASI